MDEVMRRLLGSRLLTSDSAIGCFAVCDDNDGCFLTYWYLARWVIKAVKKMIVGLHFQVQLMSCQHLFSHCIWSATHTESMVLETSLNIKAWFPRTLLTSCPQCWSDTRDMTDHLIHVKAKRGATRRRPIYTHTEMTRNWFLHDAVAKEIHQVLSRSNHRVIVKARAIPNRAIRRGTLTASSWPEWPTRIGAAPTSYCRIIYEHILHHGAFMNSNKSSAIQWPELKLRYRTIQQSEFRAGFSCTCQSNMKSKTLGHLGPTGAFH